VILGAPGEAAALIVPPPAGRELKRFSIGVSLCCSENTIRDQTDRAWIGKSVFHNAVAQTASAERAISAPRAQMAVFAKLFMATTPHKSPAFSNCAHGRVTQPADVTVVSIDCMDQER
jgi:hypothetical protein